MSNKSRQNADSASNSIAAVISVLDGITPTSLKKTNNNSSDSNPFNYVMGILQQIAGYEKIVKHISELIVYELPAIEETMKTSLKQHLKDMFSCSVNPILDRKIINEGVVLDLKAIDLLNILDHYPLEPANAANKLKGSFFYSDVEEYSIPDQLANCKDLNAVVWFVKHRSNGRTVWYGFDSQEYEHTTLTLNTKPSFTDGIITMEYSEKASQLTDSQHNPLRVQVPHGNCLHIFIGNTKGVSNISEPSSDDFVSNAKKFQDLFSNLETTLAELKETLNKTDNIQEQTEIQNDIDLINRITDEVDGGKSISEILPNMLVDNKNGMRYFTVGGKRISLDEYTYTSDKTDLSLASANITQQRLAYTENLSYRNPENNYYYNKSLFEFNSDYIDSVKFFDSKVISAQLTNILTGCFGRTINLSFEERLVRNEIEKMFTKIVESSDYVVNDCFFSFTNDEYNIMMEEAENERVGKYSGDDYANGSKIDYDRIYDELDKISSSATPSGQVTVIAGAMNEISRTIKPDDYEGDFNLELNYDFLNNLLKGLTLSFVYVIVSPKIYLLMALNLKVMGRQPNFDLTQFIEQFKTLLINITKSITDKVMEEMKAWLMSLVEDLVKRFADRLVTEQGEYYIRLLMKCMRAFQKFWGSAQNWEIADVNYADIYTDNNKQEAINTSC